MLTWKLVFNQNRQSHINHVGFLSCLFCCNNIWHCFVDIMASFSTATILILTLLCWHHGTLISLACSSCFQPWLSLFSSFSVPSSMILLSSSPQPLLSFHHSITCQINRVSNLSHSFFMAWLTVPTKYGVTIILVVSFFVAWLTIPA